MSTQQCTVCRSDKALKEFRSYAKKHRTECRECEKAVQRCAKCDAVKALTEYGPSKQMANGRFSYCRKCVAGLNGELWRANAEEINNRRRNRYATDEVHREKIKAQTSASSKKPEAKKRIKAYEHSEAGRSRHRKHRSTETYKEKNRKYLRERYHNDPAARQKRLARSNVQRAVKSGTLVKPTACGHPGKYAPQCGGKIEGHHHAGYDRENWLNVEWLCEVCHTAADAVPKEK